MHENESLTAWLLVRKQSKLTYVCYVDQMSVSLFIFPLCVFGLVLLCPVICYSDVIIVIVIV